MASEPIWIRDPGMLKSALARPRNLLAYSTTRPDLAQLAAAYAWGTTRTGRAFDIAVQVLILISLVSFSIETLPGLSQAGRLGRGTLPHAPEIDSTHHNNTRALPWAIEFEPFGLERLQSRP